MTRDELIDLIETAIDNVHDLDVTHRDYAEAAADAVLAEVQDWNDAIHAAIHAVRGLDFEYTEPVLLALRDLLRKENDR